MTDARKKQMELLRFLIPIRIARHWLEHTLKAIEKGEYPARLTEQLDMQFGGELDAAAVEDGVTFGPRQVAKMKRECVEYARGQLRQHPEKYAALIKYFRTYKTAKEIARECGARRVDCHVQGTPRVTARDTMRIHTNMLAEVVTE